MTQKWKKERRELRSKTENPMKKRRKVNDAQKKKLSKETTRIRIVTTTAMLFHKRCGWRNWHSRNRRRILDSIHEEKHSCRGWSDANCKNPVLDWHRKAAEWNLDSSKKNKTLHSRGKTEKRWEYEINEFLRSERIEEETNDVERNNDAWIKTAKDQKSLEENEKQFCNVDSCSPCTRRQRRRRTDDSVWNLLLFWLRITKTIIGRSTGMASILCLKDFRSDWWDQTTGGWRVCHFFPCLAQFLHLLKPFSVKLFRVHFVGFRTWLVCGFLCLWRALSYFRLFCGVFFIHCYIPAVSVWEEPFFSGCIPKHF